MFLSNNDARKAVFTTFNAFQDQFFAMITKYANVTAARERTAIATRFVKDIVILYLDASKDALLKEYAHPLQAIEAELAKLLDVFGEASA